MAIFADLGALAVKVTYYALRTTSYSIASVLLLGGTKVRVDKLYISNYALV